jgi:hypothetical protein
MAFRRLVVLTAVLAILATLLPSASFAAPTPQMPDLGMARLRKFTIEMTPGGQKRLRFSTKIINIGNGPFQAFGHHPQPNGEKLVDQQIRNTDGTWTTVATPGRMYFAGDGHNHWHLRDLEGYVLRNTTGPNVNRVSEKHGFCFADRGDYRLSMPNAPQNPVYEGCGNAPDVTITMGLSVGWSDTYGFRIVDQYVDITNLPNGIYTVTATADILGIFAERCEGNNSTVSRVQISGTSVTLLDDGKNSKPC